MFLKLATAGHADSVSEFQEAGGDVTPSRGHTCKGRPVHQQTLEPGVGRGTVHSLRALAGVSSSWTHHGAFCLLSKGVASRGRPA